MRKAARRDGNEQDIVDALERIGVQVWRVSQDGLPDLLCHDRRGRFKQQLWIPIEVKWPRGKLTPAQKHTHERAWFPVVETVEQALRLFGVQV